MNKLQKQIAAFAVVSLFAYSANAANVVGVDGNPATPLLIDTTDVTVTGDSVTGGDVQVSGTTLLNDTLTVQPALVTVVGPVATTPGAGEQTELGGVVPGTGGDVKVIQTLIDSNDQSQTTDTGGGFSAETNGDTTLSAATSETTSVSYGRAVTQEVAQPGNANPVGLGIPGTEEYFVVNLDTDAQIAGPFASEAALDAFLAGQTPASLLALDPSIGEVIDNPTSGGNLQVGGNANVDGTLSLADTGSGAVADVAAEINGNAAAIVAVQDDVDQNELDSDDADAALGIRIDDEIDDRIAGDAALGIRIDDEIDDRIAGDVALGFRIDDEIDDRIAGDLFLQGQINNNAAAISQNASDIASNKKNIEQNTRGIAMVAALQHTTVLPGMTNALDVAASHFEGETGMSINYARRINENWQINFGAASTTDFDESVIKAGVGVQW